MAPHAWKRELSRQRQELQLQQLEHERQEQLEGLLDAILYDENNESTNDNSFYNYPVPPSTRTENENFFKDALPPSTNIYTVPPPPDDGDEDVTWLVVAILLTALLLLIASLVRSCSQKAGMWLNGGSWNNDSPHPGHGGPGPFGHSGPGGQGGHGGRYPGSGPFQVPEDDDEETNTSTAQLSENDERLALLSDAQRQAYDSARGNKHTTTHNNTTQRTPQPKRICCCRCTGTSITTGGREGARRGSNQEQPAQQERKAQENSGRDLG